MCLKGVGLDVYSPAQKAGECTTPYVVVRDASTTQFNNFSSTVTYFDVLCYVPQQEFSTLELFVRQVKDAMRGLVPMIKPTHTETASFYDDAIKGHMISVQYRNYKKIIF